MAPHVGLLRNVYSLASFERKNTAKQHFLMSPFLFKRWFPIPVESRIACEGKRIIKRGLKAQKKVAIPRSICWSTPTTLNVFATLSASEHTGPHHSKVCSVARFALYAWMVVSGGSNYEAVLSGGHFSVGRRRDAHLQWDLWAAYLCGTRIRFVLVGRLRGGFPLLISPSIVDRHFASLTISLERTINRPSSSGR